MNIKIPSDNSTNLIVFQENGQTCDVAFDVFDCISDRITEYCSDHHLRYQQ